MVLSNVILVWMPLSFCTVSSSLSGDFRGEKVVEIGMAGIVGGGGFSIGGASDKEPSCQCGRHKWPGFDSWVGKIPWRRAWQPTPVSLPGRIPMGRRAWWARVYRVTESRTWLKWLSIHACMGMRRLNIWYNRTIKTRHTQPAGVQCHFKMHASLAFLCFLDRKGRLCELFEDLLCSIEK